MRTKRVGEEARELEAKEESQGILLCTILYGQLAAACPSSPCSVACSWEWCVPLLPTPSFPTPSAHISEYGKVLAMLGDRRFKAQCMDGKERICHIPGRFNKRMWIAVVRVPLLSPCAVSEFVCVWPHVAGERVTSTHRTHSPRVHVVPEARSCAYV